MAHTTTHQQIEAAIHGMEDIVKQLPQWRPRLGGPATAPTGLEAVRAHLTRAIAEAYEAMNLASQEEL